MNHTKALFVAICRAIIIPGFLGWCDMDFVHSIATQRGNSHFSEGSRGVQGGSLPVRKPRRGSVAGIRAGIEVWTSTGAKASASARTTTGRLCRRGGRDASFFFWAYSCPVVPFFHFFLGGRIFWAWSRFPSSALFADFLFGGGFPY